MDADQISKLSDADLGQYVEEIGGPIEIAEEEGQVAAWVHFKTERVSPDGRRKLSWHQRTGLGSSWREAMEFLAVSLADDAN